MWRQWSACGLAICFATVAPSVAQIALHCWPKGNEQTVMQLCCSNAHNPEISGYCFNGIYSYETCCLGEKTAFASWPFRTVTVGYPGSGTNSLSFLLSNHPNISQVSTDRFGRVVSMSKSHTELQAVGDFMEFGTRATIRKFGREIAKKLRFSRHLYMFLGREASGSFLCVRKRPTQSVQQKMECMLPDISQSIGSHDNSLEEH